MKNFLLALMVVLTTCTLAVAQNQNPVATTPSVRRNRLW